MTVYDAQNERFFATNSRLFTSKVSTMSRLAMIPGCDFAPDAEASEPMLNEDGGYARRGLHRRIRCFDLIPRFSVNISGIISGMILIVCANLVFCVLIIRFVQNAHAEEGDEHGRRAWECYCNHGCAVVPAGFSCSLKSDSETAPLYADWPDAQYLLDSSE